MPAMPEMPVSMSSITASVGRVSASVYPMKGWFFFYQKENRSILWKRAAAFIAEVGVASLAIFFTLCWFTFHVQRAFVRRHAPHALGTLGAVVLILIETVIPMTLIFYKRLVRVREKLFEDVMQLQDVHVEPSSPEERAWINEQRELQSTQKQEQGSPSVLRTIADPAALNSRPMFKYFITLPLNFIPVFGSIAFCWLNAMDNASILHHHYYSNLKQLSAEEEAAVIYFKRAQYQQFGVMATALTLLPGLNVILVLTNAVGAALWAADIEKALLPNA